MHLYTVRVRFDPNQTNLLGQKVADMRKVSTTGVREDILDRMENVLPGTRASIPARERAEVKEIVARSSGSFAGEPIDQPTVIAVVRTAEGVSEKLVHAVKRAAEEEVGMLSESATVVAEDDSFSWP